MKAILGVLIFSAMAMSAPLKVVTTVPDIAWAVKEIGGSRVEVKALLKGTENPHFLDAVPEFIRLVSNADVVCMVGLELEVGYMPKILARSGNAKVQPGGKGYCELGTAITALEKPTASVDRSMGDVHPFGNPHFWLGPKTFAEGVTVVAAVLSKVDPAGTADYQKGLTAVKAQLAKIYEANLALLKSRPDVFEGVLAVEYHREFAYFFQNYGLTSFGSIEEKPGVAPSAGRLAEVAQAAKAAGVKVALAAPFSPKPLMAKFQELSSIPVVTVPTSVVPSGKPADYPALQKAIVESILGAIPKKK